jgi:hypothetical protein
MFMASMVGVAMNVVGIVVAEAVGMFSHLPQQFRDVHAFSAPWIAYLVATSFRTAVSTTAQASLRFRQLFVWGTFAAALSIAMTVGIVARVGAVGAPIGLALGELVLGIIIWISLGRGIEPGESEAGRDEAQIETARCAL